jgi:hypothetical protein
VDLRTHTLLIALRGISLQASDFHPSLVPSIRHKTEIVTDTIKNRWNDPACLLMSGTSRFTVNMANRT